MAQFLVVKNFERFQHYKDRNPPWIKFHYATLSDYEVTSLSDAAQGQLFKFWLLASRYDNLIPYDLKWLKREIKANGPLQLKELLASGLLAISEQGASAPLDLTRSREEEERTETEAKTESSSTPRENLAGRKLLLEQLTPTRRRGMEHTIAMWEQGADLPPGSGIPTPEQIDTACRECIASVDAGQVSVAVLRGFLVKILRPTGVIPRIGRKPESLIEALMRPGGAA